ncbi:MAG: long-chain fatty acid--CoA ligase, partial [Sphingobacteriales bacterium]
MPEQIKRVFDLIPYSASRYNNKSFVNGKVLGQWHNLTIAEFSAKADAVSHSLIKLGLGKGSRAAIMSPNRVEWNICDLAILQIGAYQIPLYPTLGEQDIRFILNDAEINLVFVADEALYNKLSAVAATIDRAINIYTFNNVPGANCWTQLLEPAETADLQSYRDAVTEEDIITIIYTSGTTGTPKGVMLTHKNLVQNIIHSAVIFPPEVRVVVSFLPLSHIFERMIVYLYMYLGVEIFYAESMDTIVADIQHVKPNGFSCVPRLLEKIYDRIMEKGKALTGIKRALFFWSVGLAETYEMDNGWWYKFKLSIARALVFKKWNEALGGNVELLVSGGAALNVRLCRIFWAAGMPVYEGYGLTETSPVITVNEPRSVMFGTVGVPIEGVEVKIAEDGEILTRGHNVMKGYYKRDDLTAETIDADGWFHTGDIGELVNGKYLKITDRKKEIFKTAGGKYVAPQVLENKFKESSFIEQIMVVGENRRFPCALIVPAFAALKTWCAKKGIDYT